ncbi:MAG: ABC transporter ATP-binding protein [Actinomycetota bacterium]|nr:ABC transporter ATP-binding protein [Actinomycetota bacterium]
MTYLRAEKLDLAYGTRRVVEELDLEIPERSFTAIVGPNACGKSTTLRALVRLLRPQGGEVLLDDRPLRSWASKAVARVLGFLPQGTITPDGIRVEGLVRRGRYAHQGALGTWAARDDAVVAEAMAAAGVTELATRTVGELSGGQRQRVWIAMVLAQETPYLLLDEPTTFLDIAHQFELLRLLRRLVDEGRTVVVVLHDLNQACRFADYVVAMHEGQVVASGPPVEVIDAALVEKVFGLPCIVVPDPITGTPMVVAYA